MIDNIPVVCSTLRLKCKAHKSGTVLVRSFSRTHKLSLNKTKNITLWKRVPFAVRKLEELSRLGWERFLLQSVISHPEFVCVRLRPAPGYLSTLCFLFLQMWRILVTIFRRMISFEQWCLAFRFGTGLSAPFEQYVRLVPPKDRFWADPFQFVDHGESYIFFEELLYSRGRGHISVLKLLQNGEWGTPRSVLERPYHLSYPFVFSWQGICYMLPETSQNRTVEIYECTHFPDSWQLKMTLMEDLRAVDSTLIYHKEKWWLFMNIAGEEGAETVDELFLFSADDFLTGEWDPHPMNPIVSDVRKARPAGRIYEQDGFLYRPSQDCSEEYGGGINLFKIEKLSGEVYAESLVGSYRPKWDKRMIGLHTYSRDGNLSVIDLCMRRRKW